MTETMEKTNAPVYYAGRGGFRGFTGNGLKLFAMAVMLIDHLAYAWHIDDVSLPVYSAMRLIGRFAFPVFAYMIAVGARHTHDIRKYLLRLFAFALVSEIPFDLAFNITRPGLPVESSYQNVFFTLFLGLLSLAALRWFQDRLGRWYMVPAVAVQLLCMLAAEFLNTDYASAGVLSIFLFYVFADKKQAVRAPGFALAIFAAALDLMAIPYALPVGDWRAVVNMAEVPALMALPLILLHNGQRGTKMNKWVFYAFYPGHLLILFLLRLAIGRLG